MLKRIFKVLLILILIGLGLGGGLLIGFLYMCGAFQKDYTPKELVENFNKKENEIYTLKRYFNSIVPQNRFVEIEFENDNKLAKFSFMPLYSNRTPGDSFLEWNLNIKTARMDSILSTIRWNRAILKNLKGKLDDANCIGIGSGEPTRIYFKRSGTGMYSFNVFETPITDSQKTQYQDICSYIIANERLILEYGGGVFGPQCFYNK